MVIDANDTDIIMMALYYSNTIAGLRELWVKKNGIFIPCHTICDNIIKKFSPNMPSILLATYVLSGCDTVSYPYGRGEKRALKATVECYKDLQPLSCYGSENIVIDDNITSAARRFFFTLYGEKDFTGSLDEL